MRSWIILTVGVMATLHVTQAQTPMTAETLGNACMVTCEVMNGQGTEKRDLDKNDTCIGYLKGLAGAANWYGRNRNDAASLGQCPRKLLANRTASGPTEDELLSQSCKFGQWVVGRPNLYSRPAAQVALNWMQLTGCE